MYVYADITLYLNAENLILQNISRHEALSAYNWMKIRAPQPFPRLSFGGMRN